MQLLRRGDSGPAVAEIRSTLRRFGLLPDRRAVQAPEATRLRRRHRARRPGLPAARGLITDGIVGPATYRALREAGWTLGDRMLATS